MLAVSSLPSSCSDSLLLFEPCAPFDSSRHCQAQHNSRLVTDMYWWCVCEPYLGFFHSNGKKQQTKPKHLCPVALLSVVNYGEDWRTDDILVRWAHLCTNQCVLCDEVVGTRASDTSYLPACSGTGHALLDPMLKTLPWHPVGRTEGSNQPPVLLHPALAVPASSTQRKTTCLFSCSVSHPPAAASHGSLWSKSWRHFLLPPPSNLCACWKVTY